MPSGPAAAHFEGAAAACAVSAPHTAEPNCMDIFCTPCFACKTCRRETDAVRLSTSSQTEHAVHHSALSWLGLYRLLLCMEQPEPSFGTLQCPQLYADESASAKEEMVRHGHRARISKVRISKVRCPWTRTRAPVCSMATSSSCSGPLAWCAFPLAHLFQG